MAATKEPSAQPGTAGVRSVLRHPTYARLFAAQVIALLGTGLLTVALGLLAFDIAGAAAGSVLGTALTIKMVAYVAVAPVIAAGVHRLPTKGVLVGADLLRALAALSLPWVSEEWHIYALVFVLQCASATFTPAFQSLIPVVLPDPAQYTRALSLSRLAYDLESLVSPTIAAALLTVLSSSNLFLGTAVGFVASAVLVVWSKLPSKTQSHQALSFRHRIVAGVGIFRRTPTLRFVMVTNIVVACATALVLVNSVVYTRGVFGLGESALAFTLASYGVGSLFTALSIPHLVSRWGVIRVMVAGACLIAGGLTLAVAVSSFNVSTGRGWWPLMATWLVLGAGTSLINTPSARLLADASDDSNRNLVYTAQFALSHACYLVAYPVAGWVGANNLVLAVVVLAVTALAATAVVWHRGVRRHLTTASDEAS